MTIAMHKATKGRNNPWTPEEDALIRTAIKRGAPAEQILPLLDNRTLQSIQNRAARLGLTITVKMNAVALLKPAGIDGEIIKLCAYISSDSYIANYVGTTSEHVAGLRRRTLPKPRGSEGGPGRPRSPINDVPIGTEAEVHRRSAATIGSNALRDAMLTHYRTRAKREGCTPEQAMIACLYGRDAAARFAKEGNANV